MASQQQVQELTEEYSKLQQDLQTHVQLRQKLESQQQENKGVQKEFKALNDSSQIYKLVGPVLLKQEKTEAVMAVDGRLDFIENEIKRVEKQIKETQDKSDGLRMEIIKLQSEGQPEGQGGAQAQIAA